VQIYGVDLTGVNLLGSIPNVNSTIAFFGSTAGLRFISALATLSSTAGLNATGQALVAAAPTQLNNTYAVRVVRLSSGIRSRRVSEHGTSSILFLPISRNRTDFLCLFVVISSVVITHLSAVITKCSIVHLIRCVMFLGDSPDGAE